MHIWGTLCIPCIKELPELKKLSAEFSNKGIGIIGLVGDVNEDDGLDETKTIVKKKLQKYLFDIANRDIIILRVKENIYVRGDMYEKDYICRRVLLGSRGVL